MTFHSELLVDTTLWQIWKKNLNLYKSRSRKLEIKQLDLIQVIKKIQAHFTKYWEEEIVSENVLNLTHLTWLQIAPTNLANNITRKCFLVYSDVFVFLVKRLNFLPNWQNLTHDHYINTGNRKFRLNITRNSILRENYLTPMSTCFVLYFSREQQSNFKTNYKHTHKNK